MTFNAYNGLLDYVDKQPQRIEKWPVVQLASFPLDIRYLVGVSGGRDSVALLHWLTSCGYEKLIVCHLDHQLRGRSSRADASFVQRLAVAGGFTFELGTADVRALSAAKKQSIETAGREARFSFFAEVARRRRCRTIFLAHHADDLVETFLINLFRGSGTRGQRSIRPVSTRQIDGVEMTIARPLLAISRAEIDAYISAHLLRFREDATNAKLESLRNRMRHRIIPLLEEEFGRDIRVAVRRAALIAAEEDALLNELLPAQLGGATATLSTKQLRALPVALQRRLLARWLHAHEIKDISFDMLEQVRALLNSSARTAKVNLTGDRHARRRAGELFFE